MGLDGALLTEARVALPYSCLPQMRFPELQVDSKQQPGPQGALGHSPGLAPALSRAIGEPCTNELDILGVCPGSTSVSEKQKRQLGQVGNGALCLGPRNRGIFVSAELRTPQDCTGLHSSPSALTPEVSLRP